MSEDIRKMINKVKNFNQFINENKYLDPTYRKNMNIFDVPVDFMWQYREFDRCGDDNLYGDEYIEKLTTDIKENGIKIPIKLLIDGNKGLIIEGNHRLCIAIKLGLKTISVQVDSGTLGSINKHRAKPINYDSTKWGLGLWD